MLSLNPQTQKSLFNDLVKNLSVLVVQHVLLKQRSGQKMFDEDSLYAILFFLLGLVVYWSIVVNVVPVQN